MKVFYSYSHQDEALRGQLETQLAVMKKNELITDWHDSEIIAGTDWDAEIKRNLNAADIILLLVSPDFLASDYIWEVELQQAIKRHEAGEARVIPIILRPCDWKNSLLGELKALPKNGKPITQWKNRDEAFLDIVSAIRQVLDSIETIPPLPLSTICPYKGLQYFDCNEVDRQYFFGREELTGQLVDKVRQSNFLAILGSSGSGKSSVLRAGLLHQLKLGQDLSGSERWQIHIMEPGEHPLDNLAAAFVNPNLSQIERAEEFNKAKNLLKQEEGLKCLIQASDAPKIVIVIDQFEESFFLCKDQAERVNFFQCLLETLNQTNQKLCLIIAMRADFLSDCLEYEYSGLGTMIQEGLVTVTPMNREQLREVIVRPAQQVKLTVEPELINKMIQDVEGLQGSLPLLQYTLTELWKQRIDGNFTLNIYSKLGGIQGTLNKRATEVYNQFDSAEKATAKHIFCCLTQLGDELQDGTGDTLKRVLKKDLITAKHSEDLINKVLETLVKEKLIITSQPNLLATAIGGKTIVEVVHEALIRHWQVLRQWLDENREYLFQRKKIESVAQEWRRHSKSSDYLLQGKRLQAARDFKKQQEENFPLSQLAEELIQVSIQQKRNKRIQVIGIVSIISFMGIIIGGGSIWYITDLKSQQELQKNKMSLGEKLFLGSDFPPEKKNGTTLFAQGKFNEAANKFQQSLSYEPNDPEARIYLNNAYANNANSLIIAVAVPIEKSKNVAQEILRGVAQAQQEAKEQGGINGKPLQIEIVSDDNDTRLAQNLANLLVKDEKILAVVGHNASEVSTSAANVYQGKLVMISATSVSSLDLRKIMKSQPVNYIFRVVLSSQENRSFFKKYISENFPNSRILSCYDSTGEDNIWVFKKDFGIEIIDIKCDLKTPSLEHEKVINDAVNQDANGLFLSPHVNTINDAIILARNKKSLNLFGVSTLYTSETLMLKQAQVLEGMILSVYWHPDAIKNSLNRKFLEEAKHLWGKKVIQEANITWRTAMAYDATKAIIEGLRKLDKLTPNREELQKVLSDNSFEFEGVTGKVQFQQGERKSNAALCYIVRIKNQESGNGYYFEPLDKCPSIQTK